MNYYLTKERLAELQAELEEFKKGERFKIAERLKRAKEYGDLSENAEYSEAKEAQAQLESRINELEEIIRNAVIIKKAGSGGATIHIGSTLEAEKGGKIFKYTIVGSVEARPEENLISNESPLGKAFLGKKVGDTVEAQTPNGRTKYKIIKID